MQRFPITTGLLPIYRLRHSFSSKGAGVLCAGLMLARISNHLPQLLPAGNSWICCEPSFMLVPAGKGVDAAILQQTAEMVRQTCMTCSRAMRAEGIKVLELISKDLEQLSHITCQHQRTQVTHTLQVGKL